MNENNMKGNEQQNMNNSTPVWSGDEDSSKLEKAVQNKGVSKENSNSAGSASQQVSPKYQSNNQKKKQNSSSDSVFDSSSSSQRSKEEEGEDDTQSKDEYNEDFVVKNGCCKDCMKAFSKQGKSCLCQVPRLQRRSSLPQHGCKYCGCHGCNPIDIRKDKRRELKEKLKREGRYSRKQQRIIDSDDENLQLHTSFDDWHAIKAQLAEAISEFIGKLTNSSCLNPTMLGFGFPSRHTSYILGCSRKWMSEDEYKSKRPKFN